MRLAIHEIYGFVEIVSIKGLSGLSDQGRMVVMSRGSGPNPLPRDIACILILYIVMCDINMTTFDKGELTLFS